MIDATKDHQPKFALFSTCSLVQIIHAACEVANPYVRYGSSAFGFDLLDPHVVLRHFLILIAVSLMIHDYRVSSNAHRTFCMIAAAQTTTKQCQLLVGAVLF